MKRLSAALALFLALSLGAVTAVDTKSAVAGAIVTSGVAAAYLATRRGYAFGVDPTGTATDGSLQFGSQILPISGIPYVAEDIDIQRGTRELDQNNEVGVPSKQVLARTKKRGTLTLQLPDSTSAGPALFATVPIKPLGGGAAQNYLISNLGDKFTAEGITKLSVSVVEKLN